jgi:hypothetical protein
VRRQFYCITDEKTGLYGRREVYFNLLELSRPVMGLLHLYLNVHKSDNKDNNNNNEGINCIAIFNWGFK